MPTGDTMLAKIEIVPTFAAALAKAEVTLRFPRCSKLQLTATDGVDTWSLSTDDDIQALSPTDTIWAALQSAAAAVSPASEGDDSGTKPQPRWKRARLDATGKLHPPVESPLSPCSEAAASPDMYKTPKRPASARHCDVQRRSRS